MNELSLSEQREWADIRSRIKENVGTVWAVFEDLRRVRDGRLYRVDFKTFDEFVRVDLGYTGKYAHRMIQALGTKEVVESVALPAAAQIDNERKLRELNGVPDDQMADVIEAAAELAGGKKITHSHLKKAREHVSPKEPVSRAVVEDEGGREVPEHLRRAHANSGVIKQLAKRISSVGAELKRLSELPGGECIDCERCCASLSAVGNSIALSAYGVTCDRCGGNGCDTCFNRGWHPRRDLREG